MLSRPSGTQLFFTALFPSTEVLGYSQLVPPGQKSVLNFSHIF
jgi:hypothetical protein